MERETTKSKRKWLHEDYELIFSANEFDISDSPADLSKKLESLEEKMYQHARDLEFEAAGVVRDEILTLKKKCFGKTPAAKFGNQRDR